MKWSILNVTSYHDIKIQHIGFSKSWEMFFFSMVRIRRTSDILCFYKFLLLCHLLTLSGASLTRISNVVCSSKPLKSLLGHLLDSFARAALWESGLDYLHGTGHGVGCFLNVHEGPCGISYKTFADEPLEAGMIVSDGTIGCLIKQILMLTIHNNFI